MNKGSLKVGAGIGLLLLALAGCGNIDQIKKDNSSEVTPNDATITTGRVNNNVYQALMEKGKYQTSAARGLSASRMNSNYNLSNFEEGLTDLSQSPFSVDQYYFQEGQELTTETLKRWLGRKSADNPKGLNPKADGDSDDQQLASPIIFQQLEEYDFIDKNTQKLAGMSIGIALNKVYYVGNKSVEIDDEKLVETGKEVAEKVIKRIRNMKGLNDIPIMVALFEQAPADNLAGGHYFAKATSKAGKESLSKWETINENYVSLPVIKDEKNEATKDGLSTRFNEFKNNVQGFFPNLSGITGIAFYKEEALQKLTIQIETKYYSKSEITSFTQYVGKMAEESFNFKAEVEIQIGAIEGPQAFLAKDASEDSFTAHIFN